LNPLSGKNRNKGHNPKGAAATALADAGAIAANNGFGQPNGNPMIGIPVRRPLRARMRSIATPAAKSISNSFTPRNPSTITAAATNARIFDLTADLPSPQSAWSTTAMMTGFTPYKTPCTCGIFPKCTYAHAQPMTISMAGRMKQVPATMRPNIPERRWPM
jgi:hypothetical protein